MLDSLIAYLRAAVLRINQPTANMGQELDLVRACLDVMHMRMPDRLAFALHANDDTDALIRRRKAVALMCGCGLKQGVATPT